MKTKEEFNSLVIEKKLASFTPLELNSDKLKKSSVLIPIKPSLSSYNIIITTRSTKLKHHTGEMSFPGGQFDSKSDVSLRDTALRETFEEIGIFSENIKIIGRLDDLPTLTGFIIRPFVGLLLNSNEIKFKINYEEVSELVEIPIEYMIKKNVFYKIPFPKDPNNWKLLSFDYIDPVSHHKFKIWGATAHMLQEFLKKLYNINVIIPEYQRPKLSECIQFLRNRSRN